MVDEIKYLLNEEQLTSKNIQSAYLYSCHKDIELIKPGNVNIISSHKDTNAKDYIDSSILSSKMLFQEKIRNLIGLTVGYLFLVHSQVQLLLV